ncbi:MAG: ABC transporter ATP-binding protein [Calditrichaeota bacterium]|nr:MAG: ABC transporter ATP-binding protein [Calditrichota bacterium]MBL1207201.1 ABC transporter ATP-binding protein [Calditrichota bacterium]NOG47034.1 ABC transporter ATP-binding protein [Calditrichota bacterium]
MSLIQIKNLKKTYQSGNEIVKAVNNISMKIDLGEFVSVTGASGSGKSTLLTLLGGLSKPAKGTVVIDEIDIYDLSKEQRADFRKEYIGFVFQSFHLLPYLTVLENVMIPLAISDIKPSQKKAMAMLMLRKVGLDNKAKRLPNELSGGEQERVAIARALVNEPPIILADEPTGNLDSGTTNVIMKLFKQLNEQGQTIIMVTHDEQNLQFATRNIQLVDGALIN